VDDNRFTWERARRRWLFLSARALMRVGGFGAARSLGAVLGALPGALVMSRVDVRVPPLVAGPALLAGSAVFAALLAAWTANLGLDRGRSRLAPLLVVGLGAGALVAGVWDDRVALVIPQESGVGGVGCFRVAEQENKDHGSKDVQTASQLANELGSGFQAFIQGKNLDKLPLDQHEVIAARAPLPILVIENSAQLWLGPRACYAGCVGAATVWQALGQAEKIGLSQFGDGAFCAFQTQNSGQHVTVFCRRYLLDDATVDTSVVGLASDGKNDANKDCGVWLDWTLPALG